MTDRNVVSIVGDAETNTDTQAKSEGFFSDLSKIRIAADYAVELDVEQLLVSVPVCRPHKQWWNRVHPDEAYRINVGLIEVDGEDTYIVDPQLYVHPEVVKELVFKTLFLAINRVGKLFLWPIRMPNEDGRIDDWNRVARQGAEEAMSSWVRITANRAKGTYDVGRSKIELMEPKWPDKPFEEILEIAFKDTVIKDLDHPVIKALQGEV
jgi:hypothetical protein